MCLGGILLCVSLGGHLASGGSLQWTRGRSWLLLSFGRRHLEVAALEEVEHSTEVKLGDSLEVGEHWEGEGNGRRWCNATQPIISQCLLSEQEIVYSLSHEKVRN